MFVMLNILNLICICLNFALYSSIFFFMKLPEAYAIQIKMSPVSYVKLQKENKDAPYLKFWIELIY
ncbi:photosystem II protein K [Populus alba x Populus x berolinensis]|uniref:Photosystem II protein K n=1 Tax=Populus alba x Populus x berolinensis TaxID=444605 RepID=A0AAD6PRU6_9ROSI|nr:photosystem II protein K [Populus alba x Populus x berolinensis]